LQEIFSTGISNPWRAFRCKLRLSLVPNAADAARSEGAMWNNGILVWHDNCSGATLAFPAQVLR
jgi:hypothetical protein